MPQVMRCPHCSKPMQIPDNAAGKQVRCPSCQKIFPVPAVRAPEPALAAVGAGVSAAARAGSVSASPAPPSAPITTPAPPPTPTECPACKSPLLPGAIACMDCGFLLQSDTAADANEGPPNLCTNPACGVANPPGERNCQRCSTPLPTAPGTMLHNRYRIDRLLAMGGFGAVYLAKIGRAHV